MCVAALFITSCSGTSHIATSNAAAKANGLSTANAMLALYNSYQAKGTISLANASDLSNALILATGYTNLRNNKDNAEYKTSFAAGMVAAGTGLITTSNVNRVLDLLNSSTGLNVNATNIQSSVTAVSSIVSLLKALGV